VRPNPLYEGAFEVRIEYELLQRGWGHGLKTFDRELGIDPNALFEFVNNTQLKRFEDLTELYGGDQDTARRQIAMRVASEIDARGTLDVLRQGVKDRGVQFDLAYFKPGHTLAKDALDDYEGNVLTVERQLHFSTRYPDESVDLALFVNGLPIASIELKNKSTGQDAEKDAIAQYRRRDPNELFFRKRALVHFAVDPDRAFVATRLTGKDTRFLPFNVGSNGPGVSGGAGNPTARPGSYPVSYLWEQIWQRDNWLEILQRYLHIQTPNEKSVKPNPHTDPRIFPRYHQWDAVQKLVQHAQQQGAGRNYLVEHSAGSGKSNTIGWLAHRLSNLYDDQNEPVFHKVVVITDRDVLDKQLQKTIYQFDHTPGVVKKIDEDSAQLAESLADSTAKIIISTLQKYPYVLDKIAGKDLSGKKYAVIIDEAHSSQGGDAAARLKQALGSNATSFSENEENLADYMIRVRGQQPNLSYFAFTATPKSATLKLFGEPDETGNHRPFHVYSMRQAIDEGYILDVLANYVTWDSKWRIAEKYDNYTPPDTTNPEVDERRARRELVKFAELHPSSLDAKAKVIVEDFRQATMNRLGGRAKAMVVTLQPEACARFVPSDPALRGTEGLSRLRGARGVLRAARRGRRGRDRGPAQRVRRGPPPGNVRLHEGRRPARRRPGPGRVPDPGRGRQVPDRVRPAAAVRDVRGQAAHGRDRRADAVPAEPHPPPEVPG
jgi:type I restriction enzyme R subunit